MLISTVASHKLNDYCALPAEALRGEGIWAKVQPAALKVWAYLWYRSAWPTDKNPGKPKLAKQLGLSYNSLKLHWESLLDLGLIIEHEQGVEVVVPGRPVAEQTKTESQDQQPKKEKKEEEKKTEQPATRQKPLPPKRVETLAPSGGLSAQLVDAWNQANTRGLVRKDVNAGAFKPETVTVIQHVADRYDSTPQEVIRRAVVAIDRDDYRQPPAPSYIFNEANKDMFGYCFSELVKARQWAAIEKKEQQDIELVTAAFDGLIRGHESINGFRTEIPESLDVVLYNEHVEDFTSHQADVLRAVCDHYDLELSPATTEKLGYWFSRKCSDGRVERISLYNMGMGFGYDSNKHLEPYMDAAVKQLQAGD